VSVSERDLLAVDAGIRGVGRGLCGSGDKRLDGVGDMRLGGGGDMRLAGVGDMRLGGGGDMRLGGGGSRDSASANRFLRSKVEERAVPNVLFSSLTRARS
jgi:hypothetical protein